jgi:thiamine biosynthesis lipoprotein
MGVRARLVVYAPGEERAVAACRAAFKRIADLEDIMSDYRRSSELMRLCAKAGGPPVKVSPELFFVLQKAEEVSRKTDGAFDVTVGPMVSLWRTARKSGRLPTPKEIASARKRVGWRKVRLDPRRRTVRLLAAGMKLDLGGIAKGYADDEALKVLNARGIRRALVEAGGDIVTGDPPPNQKGWRIEIENMGPEGKPGFVTISNQAISTSGDTAQYVEIGGRHYSHVVDPRTGLGLTSRVNVTVLARRGITTDSLSTALSVLGPEEGRKLLQSFPGVRAFFRRVEANENPSPSTPAPPERADRPGL